MEPPDTHLLVLTNLPDADRARQLAKHLIEIRLAACINLMAPCTSIYRWQGKVETANETLLLIKTTRSRYPALEAAIQTLHPYELPEIVAVPIAAGLPPYLDWVTAETTPDDNTPC